MNRLLNATYEPMAPPPDSPSGPAQAPGREGEITTVVVSNDGIRWYAAIGVDTKTARHPSARERPWELTWA